MRESKGSEGVRKGGESDGGGIGKNEWQRVISKRNRFVLGAGSVGGRRPDVVSHKGGRRMPKNDEGTFYFTEFPENFGAREMWGVFLKFGNIHEVVIPLKRDKRGKSQEVCWICQIS